MFINARNGKKEHIFVGNGKVPNIAQIAIVSSHISGTVLTETATVTVKGVSKEHGTLEVDRVLLDEAYLNLAGTVTDAVMTVFTLDFDYDKFVGVTIEITDASSKLVEIHECHLTWNSMPILIPSTNNV
jgi:hypothetical protein